MKMVIEMANDTKYVAGYFYSVLVWNVEIVGINAGINFAPFGGIKESGIGRCWKIEYLEIKYLCFDGEKIVSWLF